MTLHIACDTSIEHPNGKEILLKNCEATRQTFDELAKLPSVWRRLTIKCFYQPLKGHTWRRHWFSYLSSIDLAGNFVPLKFRHDCMRISTDQCLDVSITTWLQANQRFADIPRAGCFNYAGGSLRNGAHHRRPPLQPSAPGTVMGLEMMCVRWRLGAPVIFACFLQLTTPKPTSNFFKRVCHR